MATFNKANAVVRAGDVVVISNGTYSGFPNPGNSGTATARITYVGNLADPSRVVVSGGTLNRSYVTLKGMKFGGVSMSPNGSTATQSDSIAYSILSSLALNGAKRCMVARNVISNTGGSVISFLSSNGDQAPSGFANCEADTLRANTITTLQIPSDQRGIRIAARSQRCVIDSNTVTGTFSASIATGRSYLFRIAQSTNNTLADNVMTLSAENLPTGQGWAFYALRDSAFGNRFVRNTFKTTGSYPIEFFQSQSGIDTWNHDVFQNTWEYCRWDIRTPQPDTYPGLYWQDGIMSDTLRNCVVKNDYYGCVVIPGVRGGPLPNGRPNVSLIDHNTLYGIASLWTAPMQFEIGAGGFESGTTLKLTNNIFYTGSTATGSRWFSAFGLRMPDNGSFQSDRNLMAHYAGASKAIWYEAGGTSGSTNPGSTGWLCQNGAARGWGSGADCSSLYGSPMFMDSSRTNFDPRLRTGSIARLAATDGTDLGAALSVVSGPDAIAPNAMTDLRATMISDHTVVLAWTAPGDDGSAGTATAYELRWSNQPITAANFTSVTPVAVQPIPAASGTAQSYAAVSLTAGTNYYWAIRARDEAGNWSVISNVVATPTPLTDSVAPNAIKDLGGS